MGSGFLGQLDSAHAKSAIQGRTEGHCQLTNVAVGKDLYSGNCTIGEKIDGQAIVYFIKMGSAHAFKFASADAGKTWYYEQEQVKFNDKGHSATFRWTDFRLKVEED